MPGFFDLPLEIRDTIYAHFLHERIQLDARQTLNSLSISRAPDGIPGEYHQNVKLFQISKAVKAEASRLVFSEVIFYFDRRPAIPETLDFLDEAFDRIKHVEFAPIRSFWPPAMTYRLMCYGDPTMLHLCRFGGLTIKRQTCIIRIDEDVVSSWYLNVNGRRRCLGAIESLVGFETVILRTTARFDMTQLREREFHLSAISALGPCVLSRSATLELEYVFHPRKHISNPVKPSPELELRYQLAWLAFRYGIRLPESRSSST